MDNKVKIVILETSDVHGNMLPINYANNNEAELGMAKAASIVKRYRDEYDNVILIDNGDMLQGTPLTYYYAKVNKGGRNPIIDVLNYMKYDAEVVGNHEFNYGREILDVALKDADYPWISANILNKDSGEPAFGKPYIIKELAGGIKVGILGLTTKYIPNWENPKVIWDLQFADVIDTAKKWVHILKEEEKVNVVVVSYHGGFERDLDSGEPTEDLTGENQGYELCMKVEGIDVLLSGHQHRYIEGKSVNGVLVVQPGTKADAIGKVEINLEKSNGVWKVSDKSSELIYCKGEETDINVVNIMKELENATQTWLDKPIGKIKGDMLVKNPLELRTRDNALIEFINKVQMDAAGTDIANTALFDNTSMGFPENVTMRDIVSNYIYPNTLKVIRVKGQDIKDAIERSAAYFETYKGELKVSREFTYPKQQHYNYDMWEGIEYEINISREAGNRVTKLNYKGKSLDLNREYDVAMNNYRAGGGGDYNMFKGKLVVKDIPIDISELIANYILKRGTIEATVDENWKVVHD